MLWLKSLSTRETSVDADKREMQRPSREEAEAAVRTLIRWAGDDPERRGAARHAQTRRQGPIANCSQAMRRMRAMSSPRCSRMSRAMADMVLVRDIPFHSHCEHHMVPFHGKAHIAYFPSQGVVGLRSWPGSSMSMPGASRRRRR